MPRGVKVQAELRVAQCLTSRPEYASCCHQSILSPNQLCLVAKTVCWGSRVHRVTVSFTLILRMGKHCRLKIMFVLNHNETEAGGTEKNLPTHTGVLMTKG